MSNYKDGSEKLITFEEYLTLGDKQGSPSNTYTVEEYIEQIETIKKHFRLSNLDIYVSERMDDILIPKRKFRTTLRNFIFLYNDVHSDELTIEIIGDIRYIKLRWD